MIDWQILANGTGFEWVHASLTKEFGFLPVTFKRSEKLTESTLAFVLSVFCLSGEEWSWIFFLLNLQFFWINLCHFGEKSTVRAHVCMCVFFKKTSCFWLVVLCACFYVPLSHLLNHSFSFKWRTNEIDRSIKCELLVTPSPITSRHIAHSSS